MRLGSGLRQEVEHLSAGDDKMRVIARTKQLQERYRDVIRRVYRANAQLFLDHTNNVYLLDQDKRPTLIVYMDESIYAAELNAQRELIRFYLQELYGEEIEVFKIAISRGSYKRNYIYRKKEDEQEATSLRRDECLPSLDSAKAAFIEKTTSSIKDSSLKASIKKAMTADLKRSKSNY